MEAANPALLSATSPCAVPLLGECCWAPACRVTSRWLPDFGDMCVARPCLPHVGVCPRSQPASGLQSFMFLWFWGMTCALLVNVDGLSVPGDVLWGAPAQGREHGH